jgi:hypothetical protein
LIRVVIFMGEELAIVVLGIGILFGLALGSMD